MHPESAQEAPEGLQGHGSALWGDVVSRYTLDQTELQILERAAKALDTASALDAVVAADGLVTEEGKPHPALSEARQQSVLAARLVAALRLPDIDAKTAQKRAGVRGVYPQTGLRSVR